VGELKNNVFDFLNRRLNLRCQLNHLLDMLDQSGQVQHDIEQEGVRPVGRPEYKRSTHGNGENGNPPTPEPTEVRRGRVRLH
jgi:hypothetical protein